MEKFENINKRFKNLKTYTDKNLGFIQIEFNKEIDSISLGLKLVKYTNLVGILSKSSTVSDPQKFNISIL